MIFHIILIIVCVVGIFFGYRKGLIHQLASLLGLIFGIVGCQLFHEQVDEFLRDFLPGLGNSIESEYTYSILASAVIFLSIYLLFLLLGGILRSAMQMIHLGAIDSVAGAVAGAFRYLLILSIVYNLILAISPNSQLLKICNHNDGNIVEVVMSMAPALLNSESFNDLALKIQLEEAKKISSNNISPKNVIAHNACYRRKNINGFQKSDKREQPTKMQITKTGNL